MIRFEGVTKIYNPETVALKSISFNIDQGEFASVVGKSGAGKTTLLKLLIAEEKPTEGKVFFEDQDVHELSALELPELRRRIGVVFQDYKLLPSKTTFENVAFVMEMLGAKEEDISRDVSEVLEIVGLVRRADHFPVQLSGGERQRVAIARALVHRPQLIIADEPTGNLDPYNQRDIVRLLARVNEMGTTVLLATHNKEVINTLGKRVITLDEGAIIRDEQKGRFVI